MEMVHPMGSINNRNLTITIVYCVHLYVRFGIIDTEGRVRVMTRDIRIHPLGNLHYLQILIVLLQRKGG